MSKIGTLKTGTFKQKMIEFIKEEQGLISNKILCLDVTSNGKIFIGTELGLNYSKDNGKFGTFPCDKVENIYCHNNDEIYFSSDKSLYLFKNNKIALVDEINEKITGIDGEDSIFVISLNTIYELKKGKLEVFYDNWKPAIGITVTKDKIREFAENSLMVFPGKRKHWRCIIHDHSNMPDLKINCIKFDKITGFLYLGTNDGLYIYDDHNGWYGHNKITALPQEEIFDIDISENGKIVCASEAGVILINKGITKYLPASRYVPCEKVNCIRISGDTIYAGTDEGLSRIYCEEITLKDKADHFYELSEKYLLRKNGYVVGVRGINGRNIEDGYPCSSDNDGLWTQMYIMSLAFRYAITKEKKVLDNARRSMNAMVYLTQAPGIKGFTARAVRFPDEPGYGKDLDMQIDGGEWHKSPVFDCEWLGETSSDEMTGHFTGFCAYYDFCANKKEKELISKTICDIMDHIIDHGYRLYDCDNLPTTWACWDPAQLNGNDMWLWEKGINSLEILTYLKVAYHVSGKEKYLNEFNRLAFDNHYLLNAAHHKREDGHDCHIDDNLAMLCTLTLMRIEDNDAIKSYIFMGLKHHWDYERIEHNAMWNFVYGAFTGDACDIDTSVKHLMNIPWNPIDFTMYNSKRKNIVFDTESEYWGIEQQMKEPFEIDEATYRVFSDNPFTERGFGKSVQSPTNYLLPYWFAKYYEIID